MGQNYDSDLPVSGRTTPSNDIERNLPSRGKVLCVLTDPELVKGIESPLSASAFTLTRARHGMHGYWLAVTAAPDVIVTDLIRPDDTSNYLMDCLARNPKTSDIPVVAIVDQLTQSEPGISALRLATSCFLKTSPAAEMVNELDRLVAIGAQRKEQTRRVEATPDYASRFDAFFAELGHASPKAPWSLGALPKSDSPSKNVRVDGGKVRRHADRSHAVRQTERRSQ